MRTSLIVSALAYTHLSAIPIERLAHFTCFAAAVHSYLEL